MRVYHTVNTHHMHALLRPPAVASQSTICYLELTTYSYLPRSGLLMEYNLLPARMLYTQLSTIVLYNYYTLKLHFDNIIADVLSVITLKVYIKTIQRFM